MKLYFDVIYSERVINQFMIACDLFDGGKKQLGIHHNVTITLKNDIIITSEYITKIIDSLLSGFNTCKKDVSFIGFRSISINANYIKPNIQTISDGERFSLFKDLLFHIGYEATTDKIMCVTSAKFIPPNVHYHAEIV